MSSNLLLNTDKRTELLSGYEHFLQQAEANKCHVIKYASLLYPEQYNNLIQKVEADIDFANRKILELSIPTISNIIQAPKIPWVLPEMPVVPKMGSSSRVPGNLSLPPEIPVMADDTKVSEPEVDLSLKWLGIAVGGLVVAPFIMKAVADNPGATRQLVHQLALLFYSDHV